MTFDKQQGLNCQKIIEGVEKFKAHFRVVWRKNCDTYVFRQIKKSLIIFGTLPRSLSFESSTRCRQYIICECLRGGWNWPPGLTRGQLLVGIEPKTVGFNPTTHTAIQTLISSRMAVDRQSNRSWNHRIRHNQGGIWGRSQWGGGVIKAGGLPYPSLSLPPPFHPIQFSDKPVGGFEGQIQWWGSSPASPPPLRMPPWA